MCQDTKIPPQVQRYNIDDEDEHSRTLPNRTYLILVILSSRNKEDRAGKHSKPIDHTHIRCITSRPRAAHNRQSSYRTFPDTIQSLYFTPGEKMGDNVNVTVVTETRKLKTPPFIIPEDAIAIGGAWDEWLEGIEREFRYFKITEAADKKDSLIIYGRREIAPLEKNLPDGAEGNAYKKLTDKLNAYFTPKKNKHHARYLFTKTRQAAGESTSSYAARLRQKAKECDFGANKDDRILEHLIQTIDNQSLIQKTISKTWTLEQILTEAGQLEDMSLQMRHEDRREQSDSQDYGDTKETHTT